MPQCLLLRLGWVDVCVPDRCSGSAFFSVVSAFLFYYHLSHGRELIASLSASIPFSLLQFIAVLQIFSPLPFWKRAEETSHNMFRAYIKAVIRLMQNYINASKLCCLNFTSSYHSFGVAGVCRNHWLDVLHFYFSFFSFISLRSCEFSCRLIRPLLVVFFLWCSLCMCAS